MMRQRIILFLHLFLGLGLRCYYDVGYLLECSWRNSLVIRFVDLLLLLIWRCSSLDPVFEPLGISIKRLSRSKISRKDNCSINISPLTSSCKAMECHFDTHARLPSPTQIFLSITIKNVWRYDSSHLSNLLWYAPSVGPSRHLFDFYAFEDWG